MIDESLLKSNFIGRDGFRWWIGQIPPIEAMGGQANGDGWGNRIKVRILGYHPYEESQLPNDELPWAQILLSTTDGSGASNYAKSHKVRPADIVFGFFLDGDNAQIPVITGVFGITDQVPRNQYSSPFVPFTGYTSRIPNDGSKLKRNEQGDEGSTAQESPVHLPPSVANRNNQISYFGGEGSTVYLATNKPGSKIGKIQNELENAIKFLENIKSYPNIAQAWIDERVEELCEEVSKKIEGITNDIVSGITNDTYEKMIPALNQGAKGVNDKVKQVVLAATDSGSTAYLAGARAQEATIKPVQELQKLIPCLISNIIKGLGSLIKDMVCALLKNVVSIVSCVIDQFIGGLLNGIIDLITGGLSAVLGGLSLLLSFSGFNLGNAIRQSAEGLLGIPFSQNCGEELEDPGVEKWTIGSGPEQSSSFDINNILSIANNAAAIASDPTSALSGVSGIAGPLDFLSSDISNPDSEGVLGGCYGGPPIACLPPTINIFGGGGSGASALPIFGSVVGETSSIIGALITSGGSGYTYPPFVSIKDNCGNGYGGVAQSVIQNGEVTAILINSEGEGYPKGENPDFTISNVIVENPGVNYQKTDKAVDNLGNEYDLVVDNGSIVYATPININEVNDRPVITVISDTGSGARLKPVFGFRGEFTGEIKKVIDCVV
jgi:hypothetical protein